MIDVHEPHEGIHSWKDILLHIGIITVGLLIAIGLEQTVVYFEHQHLVAETRRALALERKINIIHFAIATEEFHRYVPILQTDLAIYQYLSRHPGAPPEKWPGKLSSFWHMTIYDDSRWRTAQESNVLQYMPQAEVKRYSDLYRTLEAMNEAENEKVQSIAGISEIYIQQPDPSKWTPEQIKLSMDAIAVRMRDWAICANLQRNLARRNSDFTPAPTLEEIQQTEHVSLSPADVKAAMDEGNREDAAIAAVEAKSGENTPAK